MVLDLDMMTTKMMIMVVTVVKGCLGLKSWSIERRKNCYKKRSDVYIVVRIYMRYREFPFALFTDIIK